MQFKYVIVASLLLIFIAVAGCTSPSPTASPTAGVPSATPIATTVPTAIVNASPTAAPSAAPTVMPTATPRPLYGNGTPLVVSNININWDTTGYQGMAEESATMTVSNTVPNSMVLDIEVDYLVSTPTSVIDSDGTVHNLTNTITKTYTVGMLQPGEHKDVNFQVEHNKNVPATVSIILKWRGGSAKVFENTYNWPDNNLGTEEA